MKKLALFVLLGLMALPLILANPASAPANHIGTTVADIAQTSSPNFGQAVCKPAALDRKEDNGTLGFLGLTPPGNTP